MTLQITSTYFLMWYNNIASAELYSNTVFLLLIQHILCTKLN